MKRKGFTLIELLAVIAILAIIALIATPSVMNVMNDSKKESFGRSAEGLIRAANNVLMDEQMSGKVPDKIVFNFDNENDENVSKLTVSGNLPKSGSMTIKRDGKVSLAINNGKYCATKEQNENEVTVKEYTIGNCKVAIEPPSSCFVVKEKTIITNYDVNISKCKTYFGSKGIPENDVNDFCNGDEVPVPMPTRIIEYFSLKDFIDDSELSQEYFGQTIEEIGILENVEKVQGNVVVDYTCTDIIDVVIPDEINGKTVVGITGPSLYAGAFEEKNITSIVIPNNVTTIGDYAFNGNQLTSVIIPNSVKTIGDSAFSSNQLTSITIPSGITKLDDGAFAENQLTSITLPDTLTTIGWGGFSQNQLTSVIIPDSVTSIGGEAFIYNQLTNITIPSGVTVLEDYVFYANSLESIVIHDNITTIKEGAFLDNQLTSVTIPNSVTTIGEYAFFSNQLTSVVIPSSVTSIGGGAFNDNKLSDEQAFIYARNSDGTINNTKLMSYGGNKKDGITIPSSVTTIGESAFSENQLTSVTIPDGVTTIEQSAFYGNQLTSIVIPDNLTTISNSVFANNKLTSIVIPNSIKTIGSYAFSGNQLTSVIIPNSVTTIGWSAFSSNSNLALTINKPSGSITGSPWGASSVTWNG